MDRITEFRCKDARPVANQIISRDPGVPIRASALCRPRRPGGSERGPHIQIRLGAQAILLRGSHEEPRRLQELYLMKALSKLEFSNGVKLRIVNG